MHRTRGFIALLIVVTACSGSAETTTTTAGTATTATTTAATATTASTTTTTATTTTTSPATTTTIDSSMVTIPEEGSYSPVNGLVADADANLDRRAIAVKIDNHPDARPQSGLQEADGIIEILVEGGFTRFIAVFHDNDTNYVGPIRSLRPTDSTLLPAIGAPLVMSGGQPWVQGLAARRGVKLIGESTDALFRIGTRSSPHNLYADTVLVRDTADGRGFSDDPPAWLYRVGDWTVPDAPATTVTLSWSDGTVVTWKYEYGRYTRWDGETLQRYLTLEGQQRPISAQVLVILVGREYTAFPTGEGTPVPETATTGSGAAWVISRGGVWSGTWERAAITDPFRLVNADGTEAVVPAGIPWVSIFPEGRPISIS